MIISYIILIVYMIGCIFAVGLLYAEYNSDKNSDDKYAGFILVGAALSWITVIMFLTKEKK